jgi:hypothetical protein
MQQMTIRLGDEFDDALRDAVRTALAEMRAVPAEASWGLGGSQQIETLEVVIDGERVIVEAETYAGLTVTGAEVTVRRVAEAVRAVLAKARDYSSRHNSFHSNFSDPQRVVGDVRCRPWVRTQRNGRTR